MTENPHKPKEYDAILGVQATPPMSGAILGGLEGVKQRLSSTSVAQRVAALKESLKYGQAGLDLVIHILEDESPCPAQSYPCWSFYEWNLPERGELERGKPDWRRPEYMGFLPTGLTRIH